MASSAVQKNFDKKAYGDEPEFDPQKIPGKLEILKALNWYNYMATWEDASKWLGEYMGENVIPDFNHKTYGFIARMIMRGANIPELKQKLDDYVKKIKSNSNVVSLKERQNHRNLYVSEFRAYIDELLDQRKIENVLEYCQKNEIPNYIVSRVIEYLYSLKEEIEIALEETDRDIVEAYSIYTKKNLKHYLEVVQHIIDELEIYRDNKKAQRKPRKHRKSRKINPSKKVSKLKYLKIHKNTGVASVAPEKLVGAKEVWLIDTKYGNLVWVEAKDENGIDVRGTTLYNCTAKSKKCGRLLDIVIKEIASGGKRSNKKLFKQLKTKEKEATTRCNDWTLIARVFK